MAVLDKVRLLVDPTKMPIPGDVGLCMKRGRETMREGAPKRNECLSMARGDQYRFLTASNTIASQPTNTQTIEGLKGKPPHRVRATRNFIYDIVQTEVAYVTQRVPGYSVVPSGTEARKISAARTARRVAYYGYDKWNLRKVREQVARYAVVADEGFAWPYFDTSVGPYFTDEEGNIVGQGDIGIRIYGPNEVYWEPGLTFEESRWHGIEQARDPESVTQMEGYLGGKLTPDAQQLEGEESRAQSKLVLVKDYLERPSPMFPNGRWITMANDRVIVAERPYPCLDGQGNVVDEPVLHKLAYSMDPDADRDQGLVRHLIDAQRAVNHVVSKTSEWINLALNPQVLIVNGQLKDKLTDEPGGVFRAVGGGEIKWREVPPIPPELFKQKEEAIADMARIAAQNDIPSQVESGKGIQALMEKDNSRRANFLANLAEFDSRLMRHCLYLVQRHYTEPRLLQVRGEGGIGPLKDFLGAQLLDETDVRVDPDSLEPLTREGIERKIMAFAERGWVSPHAAMAAINNGTAENLVESYERDVARANLIIQKVMEGPEVLFQTAPRRPFTGEDPGLDPATGEPNQLIPGWMPRPFDDVRVQRDVISDFMKGTEYDDFDPPQQEAMNTYFDALLQQEAKQNAEAAAAQEATAQSLGMNNAAKPQGPPPLPDQAPLNQS